MAQIVIAIPPATTTNYGNIPTEDKNYDSNAQRKHRKHSKLDRQKHRKDDENVSNQQQQMRRENGKNNVELIHGNDRKQTGTGPGYMTFDINDSSVSNQISALRISSNIHGKFLGTDFLSMIVLDFPILASFLVAFLF